MARRRRDRTARRRARSALTRPIETMRLYLIGFEPHPYDETERQRMIASVDACIVRGDGSTGGYAIGDQFFYHGQLMEVIDLEAHGKIVRVALFNPSNRQN